MQRGFPTSLFQGSTDSMSFFMYWKASLLRKLHRPCILPGAYSAGGIVKGIVNVWIGVLINDMYI